MDSPCRKDRLPVDYVQRRLPGNEFRDHGERDSGESGKVFGFRPESLFTFIPESRSTSSRNPVHLPAGMPFSLARNTQPWNPVNGKPGSPIDLVANLADIWFRVIVALPYTARVVFAACGYALAATITKGDDGITYLSLDGAGIRGAEPGRFAGFKSDGKTMEEHPKR